MGVQTKGKCKYCGKEFTKGGMIKHLKACKKRAEALSAETGSKKCGYFELAVYGRYDKRYWLILEIREDALLADLDHFLRDIWLECCGHLSCFHINGVTYDAYPMNDFCDEVPSESMSCKLSTVLQEGMGFEYEYDFGSTTELELEVRGYRGGYRNRKKFALLSRNNPPELICDECHQRKAAFICTECMYEGSGLLCDECAGDHECGEEMLLPVCNSPRMGVCAYEGSDVYPDQFVSDCDRQLS